MERLASAKPSSLWRRSSRVKLQKPRAFIACPATQFASVRSAPPFWLGQGGRNLFQPWRKGPTLNQHQPLSRKPAQKNIPKHGEKLEFFARAHQRVTRRALMTEGSERAWRAKSSTKPKLCGPYCHKFFPVQFVPVMVRPETARQQGNQCVWLGIRPHWRSIRLTVLASCLPETLSREISRSMAVMLRKTVE